MYFVSSVSLCVLGKFQYFPYHTDVAILILIFVVVVVDICNRSLS